MKKNEKAIITTVITAIVVMAVIEGILEFSYLPKSIMKILVFGGVVVMHFIKNKRDLRELFVTDRKTFLLSVLCGAGVFTVITLAYKFLGFLIDPESVRKGLLGSDNITKENFPFVAAYICLGNSTLEEIFFRGYAYICLREHCNKKKAFIFSAGAFAMYHTFIMSGWFGVWAFMLIMLGLFIGGMIFNAFDDGGSIIPSLMIHMSADISIVLIGYTML